jgi:hypothetical protein
MTGQWVAVAINEGAPSHEDGGVVVIGPFELEGDAADAAETARIRGYSTELFQLTMIDYVPDLDEDRP